MRNITDLRKYRGIRLVKQVYSGDNHLIEIPKIIDKSKIDRLRSILPDYIKVKYYLPYIPDVLEAISQHDFKAARFVPLWNQNQTDKSYSSIINGTLVSVKHWSGSFDIIVDGSKNKVNSFEEMFNQFIGEYNYPCSSETKILSVNDYDPESIMKYSNEELCERLSKEKKNNPKDYKELYDAVKFLKQEYKREKIKNDKRFS